jgi:hypothetical protein
LQEASEDTPKSPVADAIDAFAFMGKRYIEFHGTRDEFNEFAQQHPGARFHDKLGWH